MHEDVAQKAISQWKAELPVPELMPLVFEDGTQCDRLEVDCGSCGRKLHSHHLRGKITRPMTNHYRLQGLAACEPCQAFTRYSLLCSGARGVIALECTTPAGVSTKQISVTWWARLRAWFF